MRQNVKYLLMPDKDISDEVQCGEKEAYDSNVQILVLPIVFPVNVYNGAKAWFGELVH